MTARIHLDDPDADPAAATEATEPQAPLTAPEWRPGDERGSGVRIEYRARVPRHLMGAAFAEAFAAIHRETQQQDGPPASD